jgi:flagellar biogenesis protein FliO
MTGGLGNPVVSTAETVGATGLSIFAIALPVIALLLVVALLFWVVRKTGRFLFGRRQAEAAAAQREP